MMLRISILITFLISTLFSDITYKVKVEPKEIYSIKSNVNGKVQFVKEDLEGKFSNGKVIIQIDDYQDRVNLENSKIKLKYLNYILKNINLTIKNTKEILSLKSDILNRVKSLKSKSNYEKELEEISFKNIKNSYLSLLQQREQTKLQISDIKSNIKLLEWNIKNKSIIINKNLYIYQFSIKKDDFASIGRELLKVADLSKAKLTLFLSKEELEGIDKKSIYIDGEKKDYKIDKIWKITDNINISSYRVEILINPPKYFSKIVTISFR